jgi:hypothetical protein
MNQRLFSALLAWRCVVRQHGCHGANLRLRDANGTIVLSDKPLGADAVTYAVPKAAGVRTTRSVALPADERRHHRRPCGHAACGLNWSGR